MTVDQTEVLAVWQKLVGDRKRGETFRLPQDITIGSYAVPAGTEVKVWRKLADEYTGRPPRLASFFLPDGQVNVRVDGFVTFKPAPGYDKFTRRGHSDMHFHWRQAEHRLRRPPE